MKLPYKGMIISFSAIVIVVIILMVMVQQHYKSGVKEEVSSVAEDVAISISNLYAVKQGIYNKQTKEVQNAIEEAIGYTRADNIIVTDFNYKIYATVIGKEQVGQSLFDAEDDVVIGDNSTIVEKTDDQYIAKYGKDIYFNGQTVGRVIVITSSDAITPSMDGYTYYFNLMSVAIVIMLLTAVVLLYLFFKKASFQLSSNQISLLITENELMKETFNVGIIVLDLELNIIEMNANAKDIFNIKKMATGYRIDKSEKQFNKKLKQALNSKDGFYNVEYNTDHDQTVLCSFKGLYDYLDKQYGMVIIIRNRTEYSQIAEELMGVKMLTDDLRAQNHEFLNKLHVISGLIQLGETEQVVEYISELTEEKQDLIGVLANNINDVYVSGILLAKYSKAMEAKINFIIDPNSNISKVPQSIGMDRFCSIIGNLLENAIEELRGKEKGEIYIKITERLDEVSISIKDNGNGIPEYLQKNIFDRGITTKSGQRGYGLWLVREAIYDANGTIDFVSDSSGTSWNIVLH